MKIYFNRLSMILMSDCGSTNRLWGIFAHPSTRRHTKYSQPSFRMKLLRSCVLTNKNVIQWNVTNHMKVPIALYPYSKFNTSLEESTFTMTKYEEIVLVLLAFTFWQFDPLRSLHHNVFIQTSNLACTMLFKS
jgi:hypothetical protein